MFVNFRKIWAKIIQYLSKNIYDNVYSEEMRNCFPKDWVRKSIFLDKFMRNFDFYFHFGDMMTEKYWRIKYIK